MNEYGNVSTQNTISGAEGSDSLVDLDCMDELLLEGCWLETTEGPELLSDSPSDFNALFDASFTWPILEAINGESNPLKSTEEERQRLSFSENLSASPSQGRNSAKSESQDGNAVCSPSLSGNFSAESSALSRRLWIGPRASTSVMDRLIKALGYMKDWAGDKNALIQIWVPVNKGGRRVLTTNDQPFSLDLNCPRLASYRNVSVNYQFSTEEDLKESVGLPGRVFMGRVPEWTPDVQFFRTDEYPRVGHAQQYDVRGTLAVPIFEQGSRNCLGVIEVVLTTQKINYRPELESVCRALQAVNLRSSDVSGAQNSKACDFSYQSALPEIQEILRAACGTYSLPLAQTWVPCIKQGKGGCRHSDENLVRCVSTVDSACYIADSHVQGFSDACSEHHLLKGQGIVGRAFTTNQPCFSPDITTFTKTDYPLSHHARIFGLCAAVAIRLRSIYSGSTDFVLEFFLPVDCKDTEEHQKMLSSLSLIIQKFCRGLRVITDKELLEENSVPSGGVSIPSYIKFGEEMSKTEHRHSAMASQRSFWTSRRAEVEETAVVASKIQNAKPAEMLSGKFSAARQSLPDISMCGDSLTRGQCSLLDVSKTAEKRGAKAEKTITLQMLRQYFAGSLKDAARNIGVCPTTLKRICRQHGIKRWPSRKIKKVGHSLQKIQRVIDSVQGASGSLQIESFYTNFPELASPNLTTAAPFSCFNSSDHPISLNTQPEASTLSPRASASKSPSSSCSHSSSSSQCCSTGTQPHPHTLKISGQEDLVKNNSTGFMLKRVRSDAQLDLPSDGPKFLPRSHSHVSFTEHPDPENLPPAPKETSWMSREGTTLRIKVTYGEEKIRFRMLNNWGYRDLLREVSGRFGVDDTTGFQLKYMDDDSEWILLTCDADLEECLDICRSSQSQTVKLSFLCASHPLHGSPSGSRSCDIS
ncbi:protein NLP5-like isoform X1 [Coffea eugenioides]|uniref:protein NLP5-like isoform X1 n=1 Tax=Coffea eugenioides TaxID=49369 RepID=UPI000F60CBCB|nr:protein NLP5-like isoform X1 [Coffea eugenioides]XP_027149960.1 protein NLP5-like isoform X1 [Coffea eugenioides]XP_027149961.1 protein NLP5-like isoform X1 [Coffea eugenioides]XP_027149962.1 protein NLP5-like isoform X1 [Coffea eugenioides]XP_027149963.1 protein NLP5-like isoform X1 [Coffea eugenioides]XP_027149964.1 protein NLP5-like isoform X1 [Coffea eugenioides]XP_027149965.1 protein NLP5-like isoform X1 [Coffea eugenioides]